MALTANKISKATNADHIADSRITDDETDISVDSGAGILLLGDALLTHHGSFIKIDDTGKTIEISADDNNTGVALSLDGANTLARLSAGLGVGSLTIDDAAGTQVLGCANALASFDNTTKVATITADPTTGIVKALASKVIQSAPAASPAASLGNGQISFYLDEAGNKLKVAVKYSNGTTKTGEVALT